jgi:ABC-type uncharacterized transport system permease subunit
MLCGVAAWAAAIVLPPWSAILGGPLRLGVEPLTATVIALVWGVVGGMIGSTFAERGDGSGSAGAPAR